MDWNVVFLIIEKHVCKYKFYFTTNVLCIPISMHAEMQCLSYIYTTAKDSTYGQLYKLLQYTWATCREKFNRKCDHILNR